MRSLTARKTKLVFETSGELRERGRYRNVIVEAHPSHVVLRLKGMHRTLSVTWEGIYALAAKCAADKLRAEKRAKRKGIST